MVGPTMDTDCSRVRQARLHSNADQGAIDDANSQQGLQRR